MPNVKRWLILILIASRLPAGTPSLIQEWSAEKITGLTLYAADGYLAALKPGGEVKTPDGRATIAISLDRFRQEAVAWDVQLLCPLLGGLKSNQTYEVSFPCKATASGVIQMAVAQTEKPWAVLPGATGQLEAGVEWRTGRLVFTAQKDHGEPLAVPRFMLAKFGAPATIYCGPIQLRELPKKLPIGLDPQWQLFLGVDTPSNFSEVPQSLAGKQGVVRPRMVTLASGTLDLGALSGEIHAKDCAVLFNAFECREAGSMRIGVSADWWVEIFLNGEKVYGTIPAGNQSQAFIPDDHVFELPVRVGRNLLAAKVLSGSKGWRFVCGSPTRAPDDPGFFVVRPGAAWKPVNMDALAVKPGTALDFSSLLGPRHEAGREGRVIINGEGRLAFEKNPDRAVRFFSFNTSLSYWRAKAHTWTHRDIEEFSSRTARQGYNMLRLHYIDRFLLGHKVHNRPLRSMKETKIPQRATEIAFDASNLDRFDYAVACLKKDGISINLDLMSATTGYTMAYPGKDPAEDSFRIQLFFNPEYRRHWEAATEFLLNHTNPYTGLKLKEDPALAIVEPYNEQDLLLYEKNQMAAFAPAFKAFLEKKYLGDGELRRAWKRDDASLESLPPIDEESLRRGDPMAADQAHFLVQTLKAQNAWYLGVLRRCGYPGLVTQWDMIMRTLELAVRAEMPVIAQHTYFAHPNKVPTKNLVTKGSNAGFSGGFENDVIVSQDSSLNSSYFRSAAAIRFLDRPFMITEYSHSAFNRFRHERGLYFGAYAALQGWDSIAAHGNLPVVVDAGYLDPFCNFENAQDPISRASETLAALAWLRADVKGASHTVQMTLSNGTLFPKFTLAAIGDDYAKLGLLTRIGIGYPEVKPLAPVGKPRTDWEISPQEFSPLNVSQWYASASSTDGKTFPGLLGELRRRGMLPATNATDYDRRVFQSETGEVTLQGNTETMTVIAPRLEGAIIKKNTPVRLGSLEIASCSRPASVAIASLEAGRGIRDAKRLLLVFATDALNTGMSFENSSRMLMLDVGHTPVLVETAALRLGIRTTHPEAAAVYSLYLDGTRAEPIASSNDQGVLSIAIDTSLLKYGTPYFEIIFP
ncbi:MAG: hypothetical protein J0L75_16160 [Spirochaetes bacterium]|nr:hypothetical protein [Spirochaetota bacterium]